MADSSVPAPAEPEREPFRILVVCTGNIHRSPLAERLLAARLPPSGDVLRVSSAGTQAVTGSPMDPVAASVLLGMGGDPVGAVSRRLTSALVAESNLVLGATAEHREAAVRLAPVRSLRRAFTLREFARLIRPEDATGLDDPALRAQALVWGAADRRGMNGSAAGDDDVADPYGRPKTEVWLCAKRIAEAVDTIVASFAGPNS